MTVNRVTSPTKRLVSAQLFVRHGDRTPVFSVGDTEFWAAALPDAGLLDKLDYAARFPDYLCDNHSVWGQLTKRGVGQLFGRGRRTWKQFSEIEGFFPEGVRLQDVVSVRSTKWSRTLQSAQSFVYGFREAQGENVEATNEPWDLYLKTCPLLRPRIDLAPTSFYDRLPHHQEKVRSQKMFCHLQLIIQIYKFDKEFNVCLFCEVQKFDVWLQGLADQLEVKEYVSGNPWTVVDYAKCLHFYGILPPHLQKEVHSSYIDYQNIISIHFEFFKNEKHSVCCIKVECVLGSHALEMDAAAQRPRNFKGTIEFKAIMTLFFTLTFVLKKYFRFNCSGGYRALSIVCMG